MFTKYKTYRPLLAQFIACSIKNFVAFHIGVTLNFATIIIPALQGITSSPGYEETLSFTNEEASWLGSLMFICQLIGSLISGWVVDVFGRKCILLISSIPCIIGLVMFYYSNSVEVIFIAYILIGIMNGISQVTCATYTGEICEKSIRAVMLCLGTVATTGGSLVLFTLDSVTNWRMASLISVIFPIISFVLVLFIPETPVWLLSKNREKEARESLQWIRGWVSFATVEHEFQIMKEGFESSQNSSRRKTTLLLSLREKLQDFIARSNIIPFFIVIMLFAISQSNGVVAITPFLIPVLKAFGVAIDANWSTVAVAAVAVIGTIGCAMSIRSLGKRKICLIGLIACLICTSGLALYSMLELPPNWNSFETHNSDIKVSWIPLVCILGLFLFTNLSIVEIPWMFTSELFSFKTRCFSSGMAMAFSLLIGFLSTKTYINLEVALSIEGTMWFFSALTALFIPLLYFFVPETEGISIEDIQTFFTHKNHKITDVNIKQFLELQKEQSEKQEIKQKQEIDTIC